jgi:site-specific DNA-methyltransferase (adenine-specific)
MIVTGNGWVMHCGDCLDVLPTIERVDHCITDPPYEAEAHTKQRRVRRGPGDRNAKVEALFFDPLTDEIRAGVARECARIVARWSMFFCQIEAVAAWRESVEAAGMNFRRAGVWIKPDGMPQLTGDRPGMGFESIVFAHAQGRSSWNGGGRVGVFVHNKNDPFGGDHPTTKPRSLMVELVSLFTDPGETILDPFAGSGTTGVAALRLGRKFIGIEKDPKYFALCVDRLRAEETGSTLRDYRAGQVPLFGGGK